MNKRSSNSSYFQYLKQRSTLGALYRKYFLYPRLTAQLAGSVLDFGCGIGDFLNSRPNTIGVDINRDNIDYCKSLGLSVELLDEKGRIPFDNRSFSGVVIDNVIEHIPSEDVDAVIDEVIRVLEPDGVVVAGVPGIKGYHSDPDHKVFYTEDDLIQLFDKHGWIVRRSFRMPLAWHFLEKYMSQYCVYAVFEARTRQ